MKWKKFRIKTTTEAEDIIISTLYDIGLEGAQIEDKVPLTALEKEQMFVDILPDGPEDDGIAYLSFFVEEDENGTLVMNGNPVTEEEVLHAVKEELDGLRLFCDIGEGSIAVDETEDIDWINNWKQYFKQFYVDDILIIPSWEKVKEEDKDKIIKICFKDIKCSQITIDTFFQQQNYISNFRDTNFTLVDLVDLIVTEYSQHLINTAIQTILCIHDILACSWGKLIVFRY